MSFHACWCLQLWSCPRFLGSRPTCHVTSTGIPFSHVCFASWILDRHQVRVRRRESAPLLWSDPRSMVLRRRRVASLLTADGILCLWRRAWRIPFPHEDTLARTILIVSATVDPGGEIQKDTGEEGLSATKLIQLGPGPRGGPSFWGCSGPCEWYVPHHGTAKFRAGVVFHCKTM